MPIFSEVKLLRGVSRLKHRDVIWDCFLFVRFLWIVSWYINHDLSPPFGIEYLWFTFYQVSEVKQKKSELFFADIAVWLRWNHDWMSCSSTKVSIDPQTPQDVNTLQQNLSQKTYELEALKKSYSQVDGDKLEMLWTPNWVNWGTS